MLLFLTFPCGDADCHVASLLAMTCRNLLRVRIARTHLGRNVVHFTRDWRCASLPGLWMSLRGAGRLPRDGTIRSPAAAHNERQHLGRIRSSLRIRLKCYFFLPFPAGTRQSVLFAAAQNEKQHFGRIRKALRICPKDYQFAKFLCGAADCHVASLLAMTC